jgi:hypothetical protein
MHSALCPFHRTSSALIIRPEFRSGSSRLDFGKAPLHRQDLGLGQGGVGEDRRSGTQSPHGPSLGSKQMIKRLLYTDVRFSIDQQIL